MKRNKISLIISFALAALAAIPSCKVQEVDVFSAKESYVYFKRYIKNKECR